MLNEYELEFLKQHIENPMLIESFDKCTQRIIENRLNELIARINTNGYTKGIDEDYKKGWKENE